MRVELESNRQIPRVALWGGLLGLIPFWGLALLGAFSERVPSIVLFNYLANYSALIVSFLGAIWWGLAVSQPNANLRRFMFGWSVLPCVLAWFALALPTAISLVVFAFLLALQLLMDYLFLWRTRTVSYWVWCLRRLLTVLAVPALLMAAFQL